MPLLAGIGALIGIIVKIIIVNKIASIIIKVVTRVLILGIIIAAFLLVLNSVQTAVSSLSASAPPLLISCYTWFVPSNFTTCITAIITVQLLIWAWHWQKYAFDFISQGVN